MRVTAAILVQFLPVLIDTNTFSVACCTLDIFASSYTISITIIFNSSVE